LIPAFEMIDIMITRMMINTLIGHSGWQKVSNLSNDVLSLIHDLVFDPKGKSNRQQSKIFCKPHQFYISKNI